MKRFEKIWMSTTERSIKKKIFTSVITCVLTYSSFTYPSTTSCLTRQHVEYSKLFRSALGYTSAYQAGLDDVHTQDVYSDHPFLPVATSRSFLRQWGHWVRQAKEHDTCHPIVPVILGGRNWGRFRNCRPHLPSVTLERLSGLPTKDMMLTEPEDRKRWKLLVEKRTRMLAQDFADLVVAQRCRERPEVGSFDSIIATWFQNWSDREKRSHRRKF